MILEALALLLLRVIYRFSNFFFVLRVQKSSACDGRDRNGCFKRNKKVLMSCVACKHKNKLSVFAEETVLRRKWIKYLIQKRKRNCEI